MENNTELDMQDLEDEVNDLENEVNNLRDYNDVDRENKYYSLELKLNELIEKIEKYDTILPKMFNKKSSCITRCEELLETLQDIYKNQVTTADADALKSIQQEIKQLDNCIKNFEANDQIHKLYKKLEKDIDDIFNKLEEMEENLFDKPRIQYLSMCTKLVEELDKKYSKVKRETADLVDRDNIVDDKEGESLKEIENKLIPLEKTIENVMNYSDDLSDLTESLSEELNNIYSEIKNLKFKGRYANNKRQELISKCEKLLLLLGSEKVKNLNIEEEDDNEELDELEEEIENIILNIKSVSKFTEDVVDNIKEDIKDLQLQIRASKNHLIKPKEVVIQELELLLQQTMEKKSNETVISTKSNNNLTAKNDNKEEEIVKELDKTIEDIKYNINEINNLTEEHDIYNIKLDIQELQSQIKISRDPQVRQRETLVNELKSLLSNKTSHQDHFSDDDGDELNEINQTIEFIQDTIKEIGETTENYIIYNLRLDIKDLYLQIKTSKNPSIKKREFIVQNLENILRKKEKDFTAKKNDLTIAKNKNQTEEVENIGSNSNTDLDISEEDDSTYSVSTDAEESENDQNMSEDEAEINNQNENKQKIINKLKIPSKFEGNTNNEESNREEENITKFKNIGKLKIPNKFDGTNNNEQSSDEDEKCETEDKEVKIINKLVVPDTFNKNSKNTIVTEAVYGKINMEKKRTIENSETSETNQVKKYFTKNSTSNTKLNKPLHSKQRNSEYYGSTNNLSLITMHEIDSNFNICLDDNMIDEADLDNYEKEFGIICLKNKINLDENEEFETLWIQLLTTV